MEPSVPDGRRLPPRSNYFSPGMITQPSYQYSIPHSRNYQNMDDSQLWVSTPDYLQSQPSIQQPYHPPTPSVLSSQVMLENMQMQHQTMMKAMQRQMQDMMSMTHHQQVTPSRQAFIADTEDFNQTVRNPYQRTQTQVPVQVERTQSPALSAITGSAGATSNTPLHINTSTRRPPRPETARPPTPRQLPKVETVESESEGPQIEWNTNRTTFSLPTKLVSSTDKQWMHETRSAPLAGSAPPLTGFPMHPVQQAPFGTLPSQQTLVQQQMQRLPMTQICNNGAVRIFPSSASTLTSDTSASEEAEKTKRRMEQVTDVKALPPDAEGARVWALSLAWTIRGDDWNAIDTDGTTIHVTQLKETTPATARLSNDLLSLILKCAGKHKANTTVEAVRGLLMEQVNGSDGATIDGMHLIEKGKGIELFQHRIRTGFRRGLGSETMSEVDQFLKAVQRDRENVTTFSRRVQELYKQACASSGETLGTSLVAHVVVNGLKTGAYRRVLEPWSKKLQLGHSSLNMKSALPEIVKKAGDVLTNSDFYRDGILGGGGGALKARAATDGGDGDYPHKRKIEELCAGIQKRDPFWSNRLTDWVTENFSCGYCMTKDGHKIHECTQLRRALEIQGRKITSIDSSSHPSTSPAGGKQPVGRSVTEGNEEKEQVESQTSEQASRATGETSVRARKSNPSPSSEGSVSPENEDSQEDDDDNALVFDDDNDADLTAAFAALKARESENGRRVSFINGREQIIKPISEKRKETEDELNGIVARLTKVEMVGHTYEDTKAGRQEYRKQVAADNNATGGLPLCERAESWVTIVKKSSNKVAKAFKTYPEFRTVCPDSGATAMIE